MIRRINITAQPPTVPATEELTLWGLGPRDLHDAYWRARGVQVVRRGEPQHLQRGAELYLLLETQQLVLFDHSSLTDPILWRGAALTRLRLMWVDQQRYTERVDVDDRGMVRSVRRQYEPRCRAVDRCMLTRQPRWARMWMAQELPELAWKRLRRAAGPGQVENRQCAGERYRLDRPEETSLYLNRLVAVWRDPDRALSGIRQVATDVWCLEGTRLPDGQVATGAVWLGRGHERLPWCLVGPAWIPDKSSPGRARHRRGRLRSIDEIEPVATPAVRRRSPRARRYPIGKRSMDVMVSGTGLALLLPLLTGIALVILIIDGRPVFFGHTRQSLRGKPFRCWKFRTMRRGAEAMKDQLPKDNDGPQVYLLQDPRVTPLGEVLRHYHLDELPQLWNVLLGEMSLVGPRPSPDNENQMCPSWREARLSVRPGITGLWQIKRTRRKNMDFQEWIRYDLEYVQRASLGLDLAILAETISAVARRFLRLQRKRPSEPDTP